MTILVTGASGFVGKALIPMLIADTAHDVIAIDRHEPTFHHHKITFLNLDITENLNRHFDADILIHLIGSPGVWFSEANPEADYKINVGTTRALLDSLNPTRIKKIVLASTWQIYGQNEPRERSQANPANLYAYHKYEAEKLCRAYCADNQIPYSILRPSWIYGPGMKKNPIFDLYNGVTYLDLNSELDFVYIDDVCTAFKMAAEGESWNNREVNVSSATGTSLHDIVDIFKKLGYQENAVDIRAHEYKRVIIHNELAKSLGWEPKIGIHEGIRRTYEHFSLS